MSRRREMIAVLLIVAGGWLIVSAGYIHAKAWLAQRLIARAWERTLAGTGEVRPWPWADTWPVARLDIARLGVQLYVLADASGRSLAFGPGHLAGSAAIGAPGNAIVAAHRDTHFAFLREAAPGEEIVVHTSDGREHRFRLAETHVIDARKDVLEFDADRPALWLLTCYPFEAAVAGGPLRFIAIAEAV